MKINNDFHELYIKAVMCVTEIQRGKVSILPNWVVLKDLLVFDNSKNPLAKPPGSKNPLEVFKRCFHRPRKSLRGGRKTKELVLVMKFGKNHLIYVSTAFVPLFAKGSPGHGKLG